MTLPLALLGISHRTLPALQLSCWRLHACSSLRRVTESFTNSLQHRHFSSALNAATPTTAVTLKRRRVLWSSDEVAKLKVLIEQSVASYDYPRWQQIAVQLSKSTGVLRTKQACHDYAVKYGLITQSQRHSRQSTQKLRLSSTGQALPKYVSGAHYAKRMIRLLQQTESQSMSRRELIRQVVDEMHREATAARRSDANSAVPDVKRPVDADKAFRLRAWQGVASTLLRSSLFTKSDDGVIQLNVPAAAEYLEKLAQVPARGWTAQQTAELAETFSSYLKSPDTVQLSDTELTAAAERLHQTVDAIRWKLLSMRNIDIKTRNRLTLDQRNTIEAMVRQGLRPREMAAAVPDADYNAVYAYAMRHRARLQKQKSLPDEQSPEANTPSDAR